MTDGLTDCPTDWPNNRPTNKKTHTKKHHLGQPLMGMKKTDFLPNKYAGRYASSHKIYFVSTILYWDIRQRELHPYLHLQGKHTWSGLEKNPYWQKQIRFYITADLTIYHMSDLTNLAPSIFEPLSLLHYLATWNRAGTEQLFMSLLQCQMSKE